MEQILKKEDKLTYKGGFLKNKKGNLVLTNQRLYFVTKNNIEMFSAPLSAIESVNPQKGIGNGIEHLYVLFNENGKDRKVKIEHFSIVSGFALGNFSKLSASYFGSWEQMINDARFGKVGQ